MAKAKTSLIFNICIFVFELVALFWMLFGNGAGVLVGNKWTVFRYFTVDSNVLMGIAALIMAIQQWLVIRGKKTEIPTWIYVFKMTATAGVTLTILVTVFYLTPFIYASLGLFALYENSNFLFHLLNPILSIVVLTCFEKTTKMKFFTTFVTLIPVFLYAIYYVGATTAHISEGVIENGYDWYGFFVSGVQYIPVVLFIVGLIAYGIGVGLWSLNRLHADKKKESVSENE